MASDLLRIQNARNAALSTGPVSPNGKAISSGNSRKHGLSGRRPVIDPARADEAEAMRAAYLAEIRPATAEGIEAIDVVVAMSLRIDDCRAALVALALEQAEEAATDWDHARRVEAEVTAEDLRRRPGTAAAKLAGTKQGAELLLGRWDALLKSLDQGTWDEADRAAALDLLGVDKAFRKPGQTALDPPEGIDPAVRVRSVIESEVAFLRSRVATTLAASDARSRSQAGTPLGVLLSKPAALLFRYEREAERRFNAALKVALAAPKAEPAPTPAPNPAPQPAARPVPAPAVLARAIGQALTAVVAVAPAPVPIAEPRPLNRRARRAEAARLRHAGR